MSRKLVVYPLLAAFLIQALGCAGAKPVVRGQSPDRLIDVARLRRTIRKDVEPVLDALSRVGRKSESAWEKAEPARAKTREWTRKGLAIAGILAFLFGWWWLEQETNTTMPLGN